MLGFSPIETFPKSPEEIVPVSFSKICRSVGRSVEDLHRPRSGGLVGRQKWGVWPAGPHHVTVSPQPFNRVGACIGWLYECSRICLFIVLSFFWSLKLWSSDLIVSLLLIYLTKSLWMWIIITQCHIFWREYYGQDQ